MPKKPHPCSSNQWEILKVGIGFRLKCMGCGHQIIIVYRSVEKNIRGLTKVKEDSQVAVPEDTVKSVMKIVRKQKNILHLSKEFAKIIIRDILYPCSRYREQGPETTRRQSKMNKYELTVVLNVKLEDEQHATAIEKVKGYITRFGGTVTNVDEWGKKRLVYETQKMHEAYHYSIQLESDSIYPNEVEAHVHTMEPVIRYLCAKTEAQEIPRSSTAGEKEEV